MVRKRRRKSKSRLYLLLLVLVALSFFYFKSVTEPVLLSEKVAFNVPSKAPTGVISQLLFEKGLTRNDWVFKVYAKIKGFESELKAGEYHFSGQVSLKDIKDKMCQGEVMSRNFTIPEGYNMEQMAEVLEENDIVNREKFFNAAQNGDYPYDYLPPVGTDRRLEGFLFPDTYQIIVGWPEEKIINMMLKRFDDILIPEWRDRAKNLNMTIKEVVTLASIIEREARVAADRPIISGVFHNRIKKKMRLQSCATVQYALGEVKEVLLYSDLEIDSPYNTYINGGLPPGPIAAPGKASLKAALYPTESNYLYFVAKPDGSHYFSRTLAEHNQAKRKYLK